MEKAASETATQAKGSPAAPRGSRTQAPGAPTAGPHRVEVAARLDGEVPEPPASQLGDGPVDGPALREPPQPHLHPGATEPGAARGVGSGVASGSISRSRQETRGQAAATSASEGTRGGSPSPKRHDPRSAAHVGSKSPPVRSAPSPPARSTWQSRREGDQPARSRRAGVQRGERRPGAPLVHHLVHPREDGERRVDRRRQTGAGRRRHGDGHHRGHGRPRLGMEGHLPGGRGRQRRAGRREERGGEEVADHGRFPRADPGGAQYHRRRRHERAHHLEHAVLHALLDGDHPVLEALRDQLRGLSVAHRIVTPTTFSTVLRPAAARRAPRRRATGGARRSPRRRSRAARRAAFALFVEDGWLSRLEGSTFGAEPGPTTWPASPSTSTIRSGTSPISIRSRIRASNRRGPPRPPPRAGPGAGRSSSAGPAAAPG